jgi:long-subunit fatty acid transport protein
MRSKLCSALGVALMGVNGIASAITDSDVNSIIPFNFANPGARSLGMGGAFLGLADDATAAYTNPAGLTQLLEPEISVEGRHTAFSVPYLAGGSYTVDPFDTSGLKSADANSSSNNLSFMSVSFPHERWSFAFYRNETLRYDNSFGAGFEGATVEVPGIGVDNIYPIAGNQSVRIIDYGFSAAFRVNDMLSLGAGISYYQFDINSFVGRYSDQFFTNPGVLLNQQAQSGSDSDYGFNLGARFAFNEQWSAGLAYREGPKFKYHANATIAALPQDNGDGTFTAVGIPPTLVEQFDDVRFKVPDVWSMGIAWRPTDAWRIDFDVDRVMYSQVSDNMTSLFGFVPGTLKRLEIPDGTEYHLGAEYTFASMSYPVSIRAGAWHDPRHSLAYKGNPLDDPSYNASQGLFGPLALAAVYGVSKGSQTHGAIGAGMAFKQFQIDFGADFSDLVDTYSISAVWRF